VVFLNYNI